jgi:hypothetical protein
VISAKTRQANSERLLRRSIEIIDEAHPVLLRKSTLTSRLFFSTRISKRVIPDYLDEFILAGQLVLLRCTPGDRIKLRLSDERVVEGYVGDIRDRKQVTHLVLTHERPSFRRDRPWSFITTPERLADAAEEITRRRQFSLKH